MTTIRHLVAAGAMLLAAAVPTIAADQDAGPPANGPAAAAPSGGPPPWAGRGPGMMGGYGWGFMEDRPLDQGADRA